MKPCLLILDDDPDNAARLTELLAQRLGLGLGVGLGVEQILSIRRLGDYRRVCRQRRPDLILVELLQRQSNGFSLAAALGRLSAAPVVLLSERAVAADAVWARARGIPHLMSRQQCLAALDVLLGSAEADHVCPDQPENSHRDESLCSAGAQEQSAEAEFKGCLREALLRESGVAPGVLAARCAIPWLHSLLPFVSDPAIREALLTLQSQNDAGSLLWLQARERLVSLLQPTAGEHLLTVARNCWRDICQVTDASQSASPSAFPVTPAASGIQRQQLLNCLQFLPGHTRDVMTQTGRQHSSASALPADQVMLLESHLGEHRSSLQWLDALVQGECARILALAAHFDPDPDPEPSPGRTALGWRHLTRLCLMLRTLRSKVSAEASAQSPPILQNCLDAVYLRRNGQPGASRETLIMMSLTLRQQSETQQLDLQRLQLPEQHVGGEEDSRPAGLERLRRQLADLIDLLSGPLTIHEKLTQLMLHSYSLRSWLDMHRMYAPVRAWRLYISCLYDYSCGLLLTSQVSEQWLMDLSSRLARVSRQDTPAQPELLSLAALELNVAGPLDASLGGCLQDEHRLLAAGLHRLPRPESWLQGVMADQQQSGTLISEVVHELTVLTEGARRLGVLRVEGLARLLLDSYRQLQAQPGRWQDRQVLRALGRAHKVLCRLLDQAAAWLPLDQPGAGLSVSDAMEMLFALFEPAPPEDLAEPAQQAWLRCQTLNRRLRHLLRNAGDVADYRALMRELLREQRRVINEQLC